MNVCGFMLCALVCVYDVRGCLCVYGCVNNVFVCLCVVGDLLCGAVYYDVLRSRVLLRGCDCVV